MRKNLEKSKNLEVELRKALRREAPPEGFAERVVYQATSARTQQRRETPQPRFRFLWPAATVAATTALVFSISIEYRSFQEERAGRQAIQALQIASEELNMARNKVLNQ
jgi:hypothetical protein